MILEIAEPGAYLSRKHDLFIVKVGDEKREIPAIKVEGIVVFENALITTSAIKLCLEREIQLVLCDRTGQLYGRFWHSSSGKNTELRRRQYAAIENACGAKIMRYILEIKLEEQRKLLRYLRNNRTIQTPETIEAMRIFDDSVHWLNRQSASISKQVLLGIEGNCANVYFQAISSMLPSKWKFSGRSQHPANDAFNALLNYAYGITYREIEKIVIISGLDPNAGFYHTDQYGKPTLTYDIIEIFRPKVDRFVIALLSKRVAKESWFEHNDIEVSLSKIGRKEVIQAFYEKVKPSLQKEAWKFTRWIVNELMGEP